MRLRSLLLIGALAVASPLRAEIYLTPFIGAAFGGNTHDGKLTYGGSLDFASENGLVGFSVDFGYTPDFLGASGLGSNNVTTLMGNLLLISPGRVRLYASGGVGLLKTRVEDAAGLFKVNSSDFGLNVGGGVLLFPGHLGLQGDLRYFRNLTDPKPDAAFDIDLGGLDYWRATVGVSVKF